MKKYIKKTIYFILVFFLSDCKKTVLLYTSVCGTIKNDAGELLQNVDISAVLNNDKNYGPVSTDAYGRFCIENLASGNYVFTFKKDGYNIASKSLSVYINTKPEDLNMTLSVKKNSLKVSPEIVEFTKSEEKQKTVYIENTSGKGDIYFSLSVAGDASSWLKIDKQNGTVSNANKFPFTITIDRTGILGTKSGTILINGGESSTLVTVNLTVANPNAPTVSINPPTGITKTSAEVLGTIVSEGDTPITEYGHVWADFASPTFENNLGLTKKGAGKLGSFSSLLSPLNPGKTYYVRAYAKNARDISYSTTEEFTTAIVSTVPSLNIININEIIDKAARVSLIIDNDGGKSITEMGVVFSTKSNPTLADAKIIAPISVGKESQIQLSGLNAGVTYFVRAFATNSIGTAYSIEKSFTTKSIATPVSLKTVAANNIENNSVTLNGNIDKLGTSPITQHGFVWSKTNANPKIENSEKVDLGNKSTDGENGSFSYKLSNLKKGMQYFFKAYCKTADGEVYYGSLREFATSESGLILYYPLNNNTTDFSGEGNNATSKAKPSTDRFGNNNSAIDLSSGAIEVNNQDYIGGFKGSLTLAFWVKVDPSNFQGDPKFLISKYIGCWNGDNDGFYIYTDSKSENMQFYVYTEGKENTFKIVNKSEIADGKWHHLVYTKSGKEVSFYIDGFSTTTPYTASFSQTKEDSWGDRIWSSLTETKLRIGNLNMCNNTTLFNGQMDEFRIYNFAMTNAQVRELFYR
ncbi:LamG-like jellyroll fold domain-containing protein [Emticicia sp. W12TSBA100-4]|uniref:LamG-like jellyroll fold domain-containing protein n=1 Tax=Emticicia sp. W12TSBA100-4 TaxID=3160965 RepID=UPI00330688D8